MKECNICFEEVTHLKQNNCIMCEFTIDRKCYIKCKYLLFFNNVYMKLSKSIMYFT